MREPPTGARIVLYDGVCALCNSATMFILQRDTAGQFLFASLQSQFATELLRAAGRNPTQLDSLHLVVDYKTPKQRILDRSDAALTIAHGLKRPWCWMSVLRFIPRCLRDSMYNVIARYRYRIFGKHESCVLPKPQWKERFID